MRNFIKKIFKIKELQMPETIFYQVLERMIEHHEIMLKMPIKHRKRAIKLYGSLAKQTLNHYDDFYEFLEHWKDYKDETTDMWD